MSRHAMVRCVVALVAGVAAVVGFATPALAQPIAPGAAGSGAYCVQKVGANGPIGALKCFDSYSAQSAFLTNGAVKLPSTALARDGVSNGNQDRVVTSAAAASSFVLSIEFSASQYRDSQITFYGGTACKQGTNYGQNMASAWNNVIGSSQAYSNCNAIHYDLSGATPGSAPGGPNYPCSGGCPQLQSMNDATSSMRWV